MRMAMKAQAQCAMSLRVLGELKTPKQVAFVKQQNVSQGHQQVNNGVVVQPATADVRAHEKTENTVTTNELTDDHGTTVDFGAAGQVGQAIKRWKPWERSTGPKTPDGKAAGFVAVGNEERTKSIWLVLLILPMSRIGQRLTGGFREHTSSALWRSCACIQCRSKGSGHNGNS